MADQIFYVGSQDRNSKLDGYVASKFLTINGHPVVDPTAGGSQEPFIYADNQGTSKTNGKLANPNNYLIVPATFSEQQARAYAARIIDIQKTPVLGSPLALGKMAGDFWPAGPQDLQRHPQWGIPADSFVPAYRSSASHYLGFVNGLTGIPLEYSERGGGITNGGPDKSGPHGVSKQNSQNLVKGLSDATAVRNPSWLTNDFRHGSQGRVSAGQIGDGKGVANWSTSQGDVNPVYPTQQNRSPQDSTGRLPGFYSGKPTPNWPTPPWIFNPR